MLLSSRLLNRESAKPANSNRLPAEITSLLPLGLFVVAPVDGAGVGGFHSLALSPRVRTN